MATHPRAAAAALVALVAVTLGLVPWHVPPGLVARAIEARTTEASGSAAAPRITAEAASLRLLPAPTLHVSNLSARLPLGGASVEAPALVARMRWLPLLAGRLDVVRVALVDPVIAVDLDADRATGGHRAVALGPPLAGLRGLSVAGAIVSLRRGGEVVANARDVAVDLEGLNTAGASVSGRLIWRGQGLEWTLGGVDAGLWRAAGRTPFEARVTSALGDFALAGDIDEGRRTLLHGAATVTLADPAGLARLLAGPAFDASLLAGLSLRATGQVSVLAGAAEIEGLRASLNGAEIEGGVQVRWDAARPAIDATVAASRLDLTGPALAFGRMSGLHPLRADGAWSVAPVRLPGLEAATLDLRWSAGQLVLGPVIVDQASGQIAARDGGFEVSLGRGTWIGGTCRLRLALAPSPAGVALRGSVAVDRADLSRAGRSAAFGATGTASGQAMVAGAGGSVAGIVASLEARGAASARSGLVSGAWVRTALEAVPVHGRRAGARTLPVEGASATLALENGRGAVSASIDSPDIRGRVGGLLHLPDWRADLDGEAARAATPAPSAEVLRLRFKGGGPLSDIRWKAGKPEPARDF